MFELFTVPTLFAQATPGATELAEILSRIEGERLGAAFVILLSGYLLDQVLKRGVERLEPSFESRRNVVRRATSLLRLGIFLMAGYLAITTLLTGQERALMGIAGTLGLALGFALKDTVSSLVAGILILVDRPFKPGDRVEFGDLYGEVESIGLRAVVLRTMARETYSIPNNRFLSEVVVSANASQLEMMADIDFYIGVAEDWELAREIVHRASVTSPYVSLERPVEILVDEVARDAAYATVIRSKAYVIDTRFENVYRTDVTRRVKRAFREARIASPYAREYIVKSPEWSQ